MEGSSSSSKSSPQSAVEDVAPKGINWIDVLILEDAKFKDRNVTLVFGDLLEEYGDLLLSCSSFPVT